MASGPDRMHRRGYEDLPVDPGFRAGCGADGAVHIHRRVYENPALRPGVLSTERFAYTGAFSKTRL